MSAAGIRRTRRTLAHRAVPGGRRYRVWRARRSATRTSCTRWCAEWCADRSLASTTSRRTCSSRSTAGCRIFGARRDSRPGSTASSRTSAPRRGTRRRADVSLDDDRDSRGRRSTVAPPMGRLRDLELRDRLEKAIAQLAGQLPAADRRALPRRRAVRGARRGARHAARNGEDAPVSREAAPAGVAAMTCTDAAGHRRSDCGGRPATSTRTSARTSRACPRCASALASARRIEASLQARPRPRRPAFHRRPCCSESAASGGAPSRTVDRLFNVAIAVALVLWSPGASSRCSTSVACIGAAGIAWGVIAAGAGRRSQPRAAPSLTPTSPPPPCSCPRSACGGGRIGAYRCRCKEGSRGSKGLNL